VTNDAEMRLEDALMNLLESPTDKLDDAKLNLGFTLALHDVDRKALVDRADSEAARYWDLTTQNHSNEHYRRYIRWRLVAEETARAAKFDPNLLPKKEKTPRWKTM
jgi:hypothetical protein